MPINKDVNLAELLKNELSVKDVAPVATYNTGYSVTVVNTKNNGNRITISKALSTRLGLKDTLSIALVPDEKTLLIASEISDIEERYLLCGDDKKICYNASLVQALSETFSLDYSKTTSKLFSNISFDVVDGIVVTAVNMGT